MKKYVRPAALILIAGSTGVAIETYLRYRRDLQAARGRVLRGSRVIETECGRIECAEQGDGPPVLVVHGAGGGHDQGLFVGRMLVGDEYRVVAPSRFGYLRTPLPADASAAAQADAHACLLDALEIRRAAVVGASAGAPSAMQFAMRHADRCAALVLISGALYAPETSHPSEAAVPGRLLQMAMQWDFATWLATKVAPRRMLQLLGVPRALHERLSPEEKQRLSDLVQSLLPISMRKAGLLNDGAVVSSLDRYPLEEISVPTLIINAADDPYGTFEAGRYTADHIPNASFVPLESGGHLLLGHEARVRAEVAGFIAEAATERRGH